MHLSSQSALVAALTCSYSRQNGATCGDGAPLLAGMRSGNVPSIPRLLTYTILFEPAVPQSQLHLSAPAPLHPITQSNLSLSALGSGARASVLAILLDRHARARDGSGGRQWRRAYDSRTPAGNHSIRRQPSASSTNLHFGDLHRPFLAANARFSRGFDALVTSQGAFRSARARFSTARCYPSSRSCVKLRGFAHPLAPGRSGWKRPRKQFPPMPSGQLVH
ncbi:hypothetical protein B0H19DRAFT_1261354 [Mycena capillaripes]|nr:hypothetical protein B0H19DRAFT_1261354 [Mycena capillaripes]